MQSPITPRSCRLVSRSAPEVCGTGSTMSESVPRPTAGHDASGCVSWPLFLLPAGEREGCSRIFLSLPRRAFQHSPYPRTDAGLWSLGSVPVGRSVSAPKASRHGAGHRLRLATAGFHGRRPASCVWSHFFPRSVGFGPTVSRASGAFTIVPSILCHDQAIPSISSYSAKPRRHSFSNTPQRFHSRKYACTELALPYSFGNAFHWQPVRNTYTIASNTLRGGSRFRPPPGRRLYLRPLTRRCFGTNGLTRSHRTSDTVHDLMKPMRHDSQADPQCKDYLRISS